MSKQKTERLNLSLTKSERKALAHVASLEDRDAGYVAAFFVRWGLKQYVNTGLSLRRMDDIRLYADKDFERDAEIRLELRTNALREILVALETGQKTKEQRSHGESPHHHQVTERKRA